MFPVSHIDRGRTVEKSSSGVNLDVNVDVAVKLEVEVEVEVIVNLIASARLGRPSAGRLARPGPGTDAV